MTERTINLSYRVTSDMQEKLKIASAKRRQSVQEMIDEGLALLLEGRVKSAVKIEGKALQVPAEHAESVKTLLDILEHPPEENSDAYVAYSLMLEYLRIFTERRRERKPNGGTKTA